MGPWASSLSPAKLMLPTLGTDVQSQQVETEGAGTRDIPRVRPCARYCLCMSSHDPICHSAKGGH